MNGRLLCIPLLAAALALGAYSGERETAPEKPPFAVSGWEVVRMRKTISGASNVVTVSFVLKNLTGLSLDRVDCAIELREAMGTKVGEMKPVPIRYFKPGDETQVKVTAEFVPAFSTYFLNFKYRSGLEVSEASYLGMSPFDGPLFVPPKPQGRYVRLMVMGYEFLNDPKTGDGLLAVKLKNFGGLPARRPKVRLRLYAQDRRLIGRVDAELRSPNLPRDSYEEIAGGEERTYRLAMRGVPAYDMYDVHIEHDPPKPEECLPGDKFAGLMDVEIIVTKATVSDGMLEIACRTRNGLQTALSALSAEFWLVQHKTVLDKEGRETIEKEAVKVATAKVDTGLSLEPGEEKNFAFKMRIPAQRFDDYGYQLAYECPGDEAPADGDAASAGTHKQSEISFEVMGGELKDGGVRLEGFVTQKGGASALDVPVVFVFMDADENVVAKREMKTTVPPNGKKSFIVSFADLPKFTDYRVEMGEPVPVK
ncbi:MAG TPA: hypothetical protein ENN09_02560 [Planctomycetes bacterium]|nr:hypothetical protein [Planctomycetota bacterium]